MTDRQGDQIQTAIVTGAARRIGRAIALALAADGWKVVVHHNASGPEAAEVVSFIEERGGTATAFACDLSREDAVDSLLDGCEAELGKPTCLINNASTFLDDKPEELSMKVWNAHMHTNLRAPVFLSVRFAERLPKGAHGNIVNIIDQRVLRPTPEYFSYTLSKSALWTATQTLAQALAPRVRVNAVGPGPVLPNVHQSEADFAHEVSKTLLKRACPPEDIAAAVRFILASPAMTGQLITLDSGQHLA
jgi:NAD(P)-dependent dehydrogenase (short-subunit alcohol dehydrogenase family)